MMQTGAKKAQSIFLKKIDIRNILKVHSSSENALATSAA
jgi:hypothetical protein